MSKQLIDPTAPQNQLSDYEPPPVFVWDTSNARSIINLVPEKIREAMLRLVSERPDLCDLDEQVLRKYVREQTGTCFTATDNRLRLNFWREFDRAIALGTDMGITSIIARVCSNEFFTKTFLKCNEKVCWMVCPVTSYLVKSEEALDFGIEELRDTLNVPHIRGNMVDHKLLNAKITIVKMLDARVHGAAVQRTLNYTKTEVGVVGNLSNEERERLIEVQIKNLENHERTTARVLETSSKAILPDGVDGI